MLSDVLSVINISRLQISHHQPISLSLKTGHLVTFVFTAIIPLGVAVEEKARTEVITMPRLDKIGKHATTVSTSDIREGKTTVTYHNTDVVVVNCSRNTITLDSGGWRTVTTKTRMNQTSRQFSLGFGVWQRNFKWYVKHHGRTYDFYDGMVFCLNGGGNG